MPQYQGIWSLQSAAQLQSTQRWVTDPSFDYTTLLLQADNAPNGAQNNTFLDSSSNNFTITRNGNTTQGTFTPYSLQPGAWSNFFGGSQSINPAASTDFQLAGDFTIEMWAYTPSTTDASIFVQQSSTNYFALNVTAGTNINVYLNNPSANFTVTDRVPATNTWNHIALVRSGSGSGNLKIYLNGIASSTTATNTSTLGYNAAFYIGALGTQSGGSFNGYISNLRVVSGTALYTSNFTPSPIPLTAVTNTKLLTCQSNAFIDTNTQVTAKTITVNGSPSVQAFSPFAPQYQWTAPVIGGSGYFDGTGDYLSATGSSATQMGTGAFTWECWCYITTTASYQCLIDTRTSPSSGSSTGMALLLDTGTFTPIAATTGTILTSSINVQRNAWNHVALTRTSGGTLTIWVNGASGGTVSNSTNLTDTALWVGGNNTSPFPAPVNGYLSNTRITKGADLYTATFTPPTAPLTTTVSSGTVGFLLNYTNAGIVDGTMKNNLETVGNAQISTSVVKYGTGSMYFDGSGDALTSNAATTNLYVFGTGDFTIEFWIYSNSFASSATVIDFRPNGDDGLTTPYPIAYWNTSGQFVYFTTTSDRITSSALSTNTWYHIAIARANGFTRMFVNGVQAGSTYTDSNNYTCGVNRPFLGGNGFSPGTFSFNGYIDDLRITKGIARYITNFTPPTVALPRQ